jgi:lipoyl(octanoyl) transferase
VALQERLEALRLEGGAPETLIVLEHPPVITLGHRGNRDNVLASRETLASLGVEVFRTSRGGDATYHGPGQVVAYPIVSLRALDLAVGEFVGVLEEAMIRTAADHGVRARRIEGTPGIFVGEDKVGAVGLHVSRGVTTHGLALNVEPDLGHFDLIVPCGLKDHGVTSLRHEKEETVDRQAVEDDLVSHLASLLDLEPTTVSLSELVGG